MCALYTPFKAVGIVCDANPFAVNRLGEEIFLTTTIGKCFQVFRFDKLAVCLVSKPVGGVISCFEVIGHDTFVAVDNTIIVYNRTNIVRKYTDHKSRICGMLAVGENLVSYDSDNNLLIFNVKERVLASSMHLLQAKNACITNVIHPSTYINKFLVSYSNGELELWNVNTKKLIYTFKSHVAYMQGKHKQQQLMASDDLSSDDDDDDLLGDGRGTSSNNSAVPQFSITCMSQSPALNVVAIGFSTGDIVLLNLKLDIVMFSFKQEGGAVTSLSFRTDVAAERFPYMVSASADGRIHVWNLGSNGNNGGANAGAANNSDDDDDDGGISIDAKLERKLQNSIEDAHFGSVSKVSFLYGEPIMISTGATDNCIKIWIFDSPDGTARLLRSREGHHGAPVRIRYYGGTTHVSMRENATAMSCEMISAGSDGTLRLFNTALETQNREMSQKPILRKLGFQRRNERLPECIGFDFSETRQRDWGDMVTVHRNHCNTYVWRFKHRVITDTVLKQPNWNTNSMKSAIDRNFHATAVAVSNCGNFCVVGHKGGAIFKYNLQSGLPRGSYPKQLAGAAAKKGNVERKLKTPGNVMFAMKELEGEAATYLNPVKDEEDEDGQKKSDSKSSSISSSGSISTAHAEQHVGEVTGLYIDITSSVMVSCGLDGLVIFWDFISQKVLHSIKCDTPCVKLEGFRDASFVAVAAQDHTIRVFDAQTFKLARRFSKGHSRAVTDMSFSADARRLLSSSADGTVRVWDLPTGRCLSWMSFESPINSIAMSLSGEYLCVSQVDKEGIYMYVDRSLYETVHFWKEPTTPTPVVTSLAKIQNSYDSTIDVEAAMAAAKKKNNKDQEDEDHADEKDEEDESSAKQAAEAEGGAVFGGEKADSESAAQRGVGTVTLSAAPKAYWASLFHLEAIKARSKPKAPPKAPALAPFFLPTVVQGGSTPSFPTPQEYKKLQANLAAEKKAEEEIAAAASLSALATTAAASSSAAPKSKAVLEAATSFFSGGTAAIAIPDDIAAAIGSPSSSSSSSSGSKKRSAKEVGASVPPSAGGSKILDTGSKKQKSEELDAAGDNNDSNDKDDDWAYSADWGSAWNDDDKAAAIPATVPGTTSSPVAPLQLSSQTSTSKIIRRRTALPRCKIAAFLYTLFPLVDIDAGKKVVFDYEDFRSAGVVSSADAAEDALLQYMKALPPPAVDVELRALCMYEEDDEGIYLLRCWIFWLAAHVASGRDFEILQAYLHRTMLIYADTMLKVPSLCGEVEQVRVVNSQASERFRALVQKNTCLFKMIANIPIL